VGPQGPQGTPGLLSSPGPYFNNTGHWSNLTAPIMIAGSVGVPAGTYTSVTFPVSYTNVPVCTVSGNSNQGGHSESNSSAYINGITVTNLGISNNSIYAALVNYICIGQ
jgi:hypothetical protein